VRSVTGGGGRYDTISRTGQILALVFTSIFSNKLSDPSTWTATSTDVGLRSCPRTQPLAGVCVLSLRTVFVVMKFLTLRILLFFDAELSSADISSKASQM
jgi:hypothetical protein